MSDYVSMRAIKLKNQIMDPLILQKAREGTLELKDLQNVPSPLREIYLQTYNYLLFPEDVSQGAHEFIYETTSPQMSHQAGLEMKRLFAWR